MDNDDGLRGNINWSETLASSSILDVDTNLHEYHLTCYSEQVWKQLSHQKQKKKSTSPNLKTSAARPRLGSISQHINQNLTREQRTGKPLHSTYCNDIFIHTMHYF